MRQRKPGWIRPCAGLGSELKVREDLGDTFMRALACFVAVSMLIAPAAMATEYHVATDGSDENTGVDAGNAFATIRRGTLALQAGDTLTVHEGTYRETVTPSNSGTTDAPIVIRAAAGETVVLRGGDLVANWEEVGPGRWKASCAESVRQVFWNGDMLPEACWPNTPNDPMQRTWAEAAEGTEPGRIVQHDLPALDFSGATLHILPGSHWICWTRKVQSTDVENKTLTFTADWDQSHAYKVKPGTRFYVFGTEALLDAPGEWWYDAVAKELHLLAPDGVSPNAQVVEVKRRELAIDLRGHQHVQVEGFIIHGATVNFSEAQHCVVENCHVRYASHFIDAQAWSPRNDSGIVVSGSDNVLRGCSVTYSAGNGITLLGKNNTVENCLVRYTDYNATDCASVWAEGRGNAIRHCTLTDSGRSVIIHRTLKAGRIEYNNLGRAGLMTGDLGITYCYDTDGEGTVIAYNWVHDNVARHTGVGIYIDNGSSNFLIHHNVSWNNNDSGIRLNTPSANNKVYHNTVFDNGNSFNYWGPDGLDDQPGCEAANNIFTDEVRTGEGMDAHDNYIGDAPGLADAKSRDFQLRDDSECIDAGVAIAGINDDYEGDAPDQGAYEHGQPRWTAGHDWGEPPEFPKPTPYTPTPQELW